MPAQSSDKTQRATGAGAEATRQGAEGLQEQVSALLGTTGRVSQEAARRTSENLELMKRLAETMMSGVQGDGLVDPPSRGAPSRGDAPDHAGARHGGDARHPGSLHPG